MEERERSGVGKPRAVRRLRERTGRQILSRHVEEKERPRARARGSEEAGGAEGCSDDEGSMYEDILVKKGKPRAAKAKSKVKTSEEWGGFTVLSDCLQVNQMSISSKADNLICSS